MKFARIKTLKGELPSYLTESVLYPIREQIGSGGYIIRADNGRGIVIQPINCSHLNGGQWDIINIPDNQGELAGQVVTIQSDQLARIKRNCNYLLSEEPVSLSLPRVSNETFARFADWLLASGTDLFHRHIDSTALYNQIVHAGPRTDLRDLVEAWEEWKEVNCE